ncbi:hypothetical protein Tco_0630714 [Tanacetum coccineum]
MLEIRDKIKPFVINKIRDGRNISVRHDRWCSQGPIDRFVPKRAIYHARFKDNEKVRVIILNGNWDWPNEWASMYPGISQIGFPIVSLKKDTIMWLDGNNKEVKFSTKVVWKCLSNDWPKVEWDDVVWFS